MTEFAAQVAVVTGAGRGIGAACARLLASKKAKVVLVSRTEAQLQDTVHTIKKQIPDAELLSHVADVADEKQVDRLFNTVQSMWGEVSILVNNAAVIAVEPFETLALATWQRLMAVNVTGLMLCSQHAFRHMQKRGGGAIVNVSSLGGIQNTEKFAGFSAYVTTKAAVIGFTESLAVEGKPWHIRVNAVAPGAVDTAMLHEAAPFLKTSTTPDDIAAVIGYLCDPVQAAKVTGSVIAIHSNE